MRIEVELVRERRSENLDLPPGTTGLEVLRQLRLAPDAHLVFRSDVPLPLDEPLHDADRLVVIGVVSGG